MSFGLELTHFGAIVDVPAYEDKRTYYDRAMDRALAFKREREYSETMKRIKEADSVNPKFDFTDVPKEWIKESQGLYVLVHGLNGHPGIWQTHVDILKKNTGFDLFVPYVPLKGNTTVEAAATPILTHIKDYIAKHPAKPITLIGVSNGGRICTWLDLELRDPSILNPIRVSTIAAVHFGSSRMDLLHKSYQITGWSNGYDISILKDLSYASEKADEILARLSQQLPPFVVRNYEFIASTEDLQVPELDSSAPDLGCHHNRTVHIVHGYDHNGIVAGVAQQQIQSCNAWMENNFPDIVYWN